jgi:hypothetical protein
MNAKHLTVALAAALSIGTVSPDAVAGKGGAGAIGGGSGGGMPGMGMVGGGPGVGSASKDVRSGAGARDVHGKGGNQAASGGMSKRKDAETPILERHRIGEKDGVGERVRKGDLAQ